MARQRFIWPDLWSDPTFGKLTDSERVFFIGCFSNADDEGRLLGDPAYLRSVIYPYSDMSTKRIQGIRDKVVAKMRSLILYERDGVEVLAFLKWGEWQKPKYPKPSKLPPPLQDVSAKASGSLPQGSPVGWVGLDRDGMGRVDQAKVGGKAEATAEDLSIREEIMGSLEQATLRAVR